MSSTNRGSDREALDFYATPAWAIEAVIPYLSERPGCVIDPGCGDGAIGAVVGPRYDVPLIGIELDQRRGAQAAATNHYTDVHCVDFLTHPGGALWRTAPLIIGNPPYNLAMAFVVRSLELVDTAGGGTVCMLLRLPWLASKGRRDFHRAKPADVYVLPQRPSFCWSHTYTIECDECGDRKHVERVAVSQKARGGNYVCDDCGGVALWKHKSTVTTDSCDYAWFTWGAGHGGRWVVL